jgi:hypothetical protein
MPPSHISTTSGAGRLQQALPDAMKPGIHGARTHWIPGFMPFRLARRIRTVMLMVPV